MFFKTLTESQELAKLLGFDLDDLEKRTESDYALRSSIAVTIEGTPVSTFALAKATVSWLGNVRGSLLWVTEYGIWPSRENRHLYFRLRSSYGDQHDLPAAPGHYFLDFEMPDLVTYLDLCLQFGWGAHLLSTPNWASVWLSHDGWMRVESESRLELVARDLQGFGLTYDERKVH